MKKKHADASEDRLTVGQKIVFAFGNTPSGIMVNSLNWLTMPIYNMALGVSPVLLGFAMGIPKIWDALTDPWMGNITDNTRTRWGRRRPFLAIGAVLGALVYAFIWNPPKLGETGLFIYFTFIGILLSTAYTVYIVPMNGLASELTYDYNERTRLMTWRAWGGTLFGLVIAWTYKLCFLGTAQGASMQAGIRKVLGHGTTDRIMQFFGSTELEGARAMGWIFAGLILLTGITPAFVLREKVSATRNQRKIGFKESFGYTLKNRTFLLLCGIVFFVISGIFMIAPLQSYICIYYIYDGDRAAGAQLIGLSQTVWTIANMISIPIIGWCGVRFGKKQTLLAAMALAIIGNLLRWVCMNPRYPYLFLANQALMAPGMVAIWIMEASMIADVTDMDELETGLRREGMFGAVQSFVFKLSNAAVLGVSGLLIAFTGVNIDLIGPQDQPTVLKMRMLFTFVPAIFIAIAALFAWRYPLTRERCAEIRAELTRRRTQNPV
jgi:GPH family glycoside/pentoside/hexuronide:cation symporter